MTDQNPYTTPDASLAVDMAETYQPSVFSFSGRIGRLRYLAYLTGVYLVFTAIVFSIMALGVLRVDASGMPDLSVFTIIIMSVIYIVLLVIVFTFGRRRMNDLNRSGWWMLLFIVPLANLLLALYMIFGPGTDGVNDYGAAPDENTLGVKILGLFFPIIALIGIVAAVAIPAISNF
jgi:uncharacterized membrane protein YhaH (DUF805 family)